MVVLAGGCLHACKYMHVSLLAYMHVSLEVHLCACEAHVPRAVCCELSPESHHVTSPRYLPSRFDDFLHIPHMIPLLNRGWRRISLPPRSCCSACSLVFVSCDARKTSDIHS